MEIFSRFCNICCKSVNNLQNICEGNTDLIKNTLITFIGHEGIINNNTIYLCQLCCDQVIHFSKFRGLCFNNLIQLRLLYLNKLSKLELKDDASTYKNMSEEFLQEILRNNKGTDSASTNLKVINECVFESNSNSNVVESSNETHANNNEISENTSEDVEENDVKNESVEENSALDILELGKIKTELSDGVDLKLTPEEYQKINSDPATVNNSNESDNIPQVEFSEHLNIKQSNSASRRLELQKNQYESKDVSFEFVNVKNEDDTVEVNLQSSGCNSKLPAGITTTELPPQCPLHSDDHRNSKLSTTQSSAEHVRVDSSTELHTCDICKKTFRYSSSLIVHQRTHFGVRPYICTVCDKSFTTSSSLNRHERMHSTDRPFKCTVCNKSFTKSSNLTKHGRTHCDDRPFKCSICNKTFRYPSTLALHERKHMGHCPFKCSVCNKAFAQSAHLISHERIHTGDRPYKCSICEKSFTHSSNLIAHERIHSGYKPYKCTVCNKSFTKSNDATRHERIHTDSRPHKCTVCNKAFRESFHLTAHKQTHTKCKPFKCTVCNKGFKQASLLTGHKCKHKPDKP